MGPEWGGGSRMVNGRGVVDGGRSGGSGGRERMVEKKGGSGWGQELGEWGYQVHGTAFAYQIHNREKRASSKCQECCLVRYQVQLSPGNTCAHMLAHRCPQMASTLSTSLTGVRNSMT